MKQGWFLTVAFAAGLGLGEIDLGPAQAAVLLSQKVTVSKDITQAACDPFRTRVKSAMCADAEEKLGLNPGDCDVEEGTVTSIVFHGDGTCNASTSFEFEYDGVKRTR